MDDVMACMNPDQVPEQVFKLPEEFVKQWLNSHSGRLDLQNCHLTPRQLNTVISHLPACTHVTVLHLPSLHSSDHTNHVLEALDGVLGKLKGLRVLGLHGLRLHMEHMHVLVSMCSVMPVSYTHLTLPTKA